MAAGDTSEPAGAAGSETIADTGATTAGTAGTASTLGTAGAGGADVTPEDPRPSRFDAAYARWLDAAPSRYVFKQCGTGFVQPSCTLVAAENGRVVAQELGDLDGTWTATDVEPVEPFESTFESLKDTTCKVTAELDERWGYPKETYFDCGGEGWGQSVRCFAPDTLDLDVCRGDDGP